MNPYVILAFIVMIGLGENVVQAGDCPGPGCPAAPAPAVGEELSCPGPSCPADSASKVAGEEKNYEIKPTPFEAPKIIERSLTPDTGRHIEFETDINMPIVEEKPEKKERKDEKKK